MSTKTMRGFDELLASTKAPTINLVALPTRFVTANELQEGATALQLAAENLRRKKAAQIEADGRLFTSVKEFQSWMTDIALRHLADIASYVADPDLGPDYLLEEYAGAQPEEDLSAEGEEKKVFTVGDWQKHLRLQIDNYLNCGDPRVALPLEATEVAFWLSHKPLSKYDLAEMAKKLVRDSVLYQDRHGDIEVLGERYFLNKRFNTLKEPQQTETKSKIKDAIRAQTDRINEEIEQMRALKAAEVRSNITRLLSPDFCDLPILEVLDDSRTGRTGTLVPGGAINFLVTADSIEILDVAGAPESGFAHLKAVEDTYPDHKIRVARRTLKGRDGKLAKPDDLPKISVPLEISKDKEHNNDYIRASKFAWRTLRSAIDRALVAQRKAIDGLYHDEFHNGELGQYSPCMTGFVYKVFGPNKTVDQETPMDESRLVVERFEASEGNTRIRVVGHDPAFTEFLEKQACLAPDGYPEGDRFAGCPALIKLVLQRDFGVKPKAMNGKVVAQESEAVAAT